MNKRVTGASKELLACEYLRKEGYFIIETNFRVRQGEIDIVARDIDGTICFVEVKYRRDGSTGGALAAVDVRKQRQICKVSLFYMNKNKISPYNTSIRYDVIGIEGDEITHIKNAFPYIA